MSLHSNARRSHLPRVGAIAAAAAIALTAPLGSAGADPASDTADAGDVSPQDITDRIDDDATWAHMEALYDIALANDGHRAAGTAGYAETIDYVEAQLQDAGYDTWRQPVPFVYTEVLSNEVAQLTPSEQDLENDVFSGSPGTEGELVADLVVPENSLGCVAEDWGDVDPSGQIALVQRGDCPFGEKSIAAGELGASAILIYNNEPGPLNNASLGETLPEHISSTGISGDQGAALLADLAEGPVTVRMDLDILVEDRVDDNLFAETPSGDPDNLIVVGAHADGVPAGPGMHDNASGTAAVLEIARQMHDEPVRNKVRFAFWSVEEIGLIGSYHYVENLTPEELEQHKATVNLDMVAPLDHQNTIGVIDQGSGQMPKVLTDYFDSVEHPAETGAAGANSDHWPFMEAGIPATGMIAWYDDNYHTIDDDLDNVSATSLGNSSRAGGLLAVALGYDISLADERPEPSVKRVAGTNRYDTAGALAADALDPSTVYLTSGVNYPDALAVAPLAAEQDHPVLLTRPDRLPAHTAQALTGLGTTEVVIVGGEAAVAEDVADQVSELGIEVTRVAGTNRYDTAAQLTQLDNERPIDTIFVASGLSFPDALSAGALAGATRDRVLLSKIETTTPWTWAAYQELSPQNVTIVGGEGVINGEIFDWFSEDSVVDRIAGDNRYETSALLAEEFVDHGVLYLVSGDTYADALAASAAAGSHPAPLLLTAPTELSPETAAAIEARDPHSVVVVGGSAAVSDDVLDEVAALIGADGAGAGQVTSTGTADQVGDHKSETLLSR